MNMFNDEKVNNVMINNEIIDDDSIEKIILCNGTLQKLTIKNCCNLKKVKIDLYNINEVEVIIEDCPNLILIDYQNIVDKTFFHIKSGVNKLEFLSIKNVDNLCLDNESFNNLKNLILISVKDTNIRLDNMVNLETVFLRNIRLEDINLTSNKLNEIKICFISYIKHISITGNLDNLTLLSLHKIYFESLNINNTFPNIKCLFLNVNERSKFPYIKLPDIKDKKINFILNRDIQYHISIKKFIKNNKVILEDVLGCKITLDMLSFYNASVKSARNY